MCDVAICVVRYSLMCDVAICVVQYSLMCDVALCVVQYSLHDVRSCVVCCGIQSGVLCSAVF